MNTLYQKYFIPNKYSKWYFTIINSPKNNLNYYEKHHILPRCMGGTNNKENVVKLSAKQHYICHKLLTKMVRNNSHRTKMYFALHRMIYSNSKNMLRYFPSANQYEKLRIIHSKNVSELMSKPKTKQHIKNIIKANKKRVKGKTLVEQYGQKKADEIKAKMSESRTGNKNGMFGKTNKISVDGIVYNSTKEAGLIFGLSARQMGDRAHSKKYPNIFLLK